jgi:hypothetical protein
MKLNNSIVQDPNEIVNVTSLNARSIPTEIHLLVTVFLTLVLKMLNEHGRDASKPAGN